MLKTNPNLHEINKNPIGVVRKYQNKTLMFVNNTENLKDVTCRFYEMNGEFNSIFKKKNKKILNFLKLDIKVVNKENNELFYVELKLKFNLDKKLFFLSNTYGITELFFTKMTGKWENYCKYVCKKFKKFPLKCDFHRIERLFTV